MTTSFREKVSKADHALTFGDVILLPNWVEVEPKEVDVVTRVSVNRPLNIPFVSSPMDTVTEDELAIALTRHGGLGVLHRNCTLEEQVEMAKKVKRAESLIIREVITIEPRQTVKDAVEIMEKHSISGLPVVRKGKLVGLVTGRDVRFSDLGLRIEEVMTRKVITAEEGIDIDKARRILHENRIEKLPIVDKKGRLTGLITFRDIMLRGKFPNAVRDENGRLLCAAAISPFEPKRAKELDEYADVLVTDVAHFHNRNIFEAMKRVLAEVSADVVVGNIGTYKAAEDSLTELERISGFRVGIGSGSICKTTEIIKAGSPTLYAVAQVADALKDYGVEVPIIADGGIRTPGDVAISLAAGASAVMMGNVFARCKEAPGESTTIEGRYYKQYRGMASPSAMAKRFILDRYGIPSPAKKIPEGVEGWVPYKGELATVVEEFVSGLKAAMGYAGAKNIHELREKARFAVLTPTGVREARPHDILLPSEIG